MKVADFWFSHPVFTREEFAKFLHSPRQKSERTVDAHLRRYLKLGRIGRVKRGLYFSAAPGDRATKADVDYLLLASRWAPDAIVAYHSALEAHGYAQSHFEQFYVLTATKTKPGSFRRRTFTPVAQPARLRSAGRTSDFTTELERRGLPLLATSLERTLVDALDRPDLCGGLEEAWRSLSSMPMLDLSAVVEYVKLRGEATLAAAVGLFLERHREQFAAGDEHLDALRAMSPKQPHYYSREDGGRLVDGWNLIVSEPLVDDEWGTDR